MNNKLKYITIISIVLFALPVIVNANTYINDWNDLNDTRNNLNGNYILNNSLDNTTEGYIEYNCPKTEGWEPIGEFNNEFNGSFDGNGYEISDLYISREDNQVGLFGDIGEEGIVKNVNLENISVRGGAQVGGLVGRNYGILENNSVSGYIEGANTVGGGVGNNLGNLSNVSSSANVEGFEMVGGLVGSNPSGLIFESLFEGEVIGNNTIGGISGLNQGAILNSYSTGNVSEEKSSMGTSGKIGVGGITGNNEGKINNSNSTGNIVGNYSVGGIAGVNLENVSNSNSNANITGNMDIGGLIGSNQGTISKSYATGNVTGGEGVGGLIGDNFYGTPIVEKSYSTGIVIGDSYVGGLIGRNNGGIFSSKSNNTIEGVYEKIGGLVGYQDSEGIIYNSSAGGNIKVKSVTGTQRGVGGLIGENNGTVSNSHATGDVNAEANWVGGLVGENKNIVNNSYSIGIVEGGLNTGGLIGGNSPGAIIRKSFSKGNVTGMERVGGLVGTNFGDVENSYATGSVTEEEPIETSGVGGLIGNHEGSVSNSYSTGIVTGDESWKIGGLIGRNYNGEVTDSYWDLNTSEQEDSEGGIEKTTSEMQDIETFNETWDITITHEDELEYYYPFLSWQTGNSTTWQIYEAPKYNLTVNIEGEGNITANWNNQEKNITHENNETISNITEGTNITLTAQPNQDWHFHEWTGETDEIDDPKSNETFITMEDNYNITAHFTEEEPPEQYELAIDIDGEGSVEIDPDQEEYEEGEEVTLTADPDEGWTFKEWTGDYEETDEEITITMDQDKTITAVFEEADPEPKTVTPTGVPGHNIITILMLFIGAIIVYMKQNY